jgi:hypothetical protein
MERDEIPRRICIDRLTPAETAIRAAVDAVERAGAHPLLTDAVVLLGRARDRVADFVDGVEPRDTCGEFDIEGDLKSKSEHETILKFFAYKHLPVKLQGVSERFAAQAHGIMELPRSAERTVALRKLLESKDAAVRAALPSK